MSSMNFFRLCKILADHDKVQITGARNTTCWRRQLSVHGKVLTMHGGGVDELHREMDTKKLQWRGINET